MVNPVVSIDRARRDKHEKTEKAEKTGKGEKAEKAEKKRVPDNWRARLAKRKNGELVPTVGNATSILLHDDAWQGVLGFNQLAGRIETLRTPPWHVSERFDDDRPGPWRDIDTTRVSCWLSRMYDLHVPTGPVHDAVQIAAAKAPFHPVRAWLERMGPKWDGKKRLPTLLQQVAAVRDNDYVRAVVTKWFVSAVARAMQPGCQADHVLVLEGDQRSGKSKFFRTITGNDDWYLETNVELGSTAAMHVIARKWIVELAELDSLSRVEASRTKAFVTCRIDTYRRPYGREVIDQPRQCVLGGTINDFEYLQDATGGGRWWGIRSLATQLRPIDIDAVYNLREQLWAEAFVRYKRKESWHLKTAKLITQAAAEQENRRAHDPWEDLVGSFLDKKLQCNPCKVQSITGHFLLTQVLRIPPENLRRADQMRIASVLRALGWHKATRNYSSGSKSRHSVYEKSIQPRDD